MTIKKAQAGTKVSKALIKKNIKDATTGGGVNSKPIFTKKELKTNPKIPNTSGNAKNGKKVCKSGCK